GGAGKSRDRLPRDGHGRPDAARSPGVESWRLPSQRDRATARRGAIVIRALLAASLLLAAVAWSLDTARADEAKTASAPEDLPDDPARPLVQGKCTLCHTPASTTHQPRPDPACQRPADRMGRFVPPAPAGEA